MKAIFIKQRRRDRRALSVRTHLRRTSNLPRLSVSRSTKHISAQIIDDLKGTTLASATTTARSEGGSITNASTTSRARP